MSDHPRCLIADDHPALVAAVSDFLRAHDFEIVGPFGDGRRARAAAEEEQPELALVDYRMPRLAGEELITALRAAAPDMRIAVYTADADDALVQEALAAGAAAILLKEAPLGDLVRALEAILAGRSYLDPALAQIVHARQRAARTTLTEREVDVLRLLAEGLSHDEIGCRLSISPETVRTHVRKACDRLNAATRTQAVATALRQGLIG